MNKETLEGLLLVLTDSAKFVKDQFVPRHLGLAITFLAFSVVVFLFFLGTLLLGIWEGLLLWEVPPWAASLVLAFCLLLTLLYTLKRATKAMEPKALRTPTHKRITINDIAIAFLEGFFNR